MARDGPGPTDPTAGDGDRDWRLDSFPTVASPRALLVGLTATLLVAVLFAGATSTTAFGAYNPSWDGSQQLRATASGVGADGVTATDTAAYADVRPDSTTAVVLAPDRRYGPSAAGNLSRFVRRGGTLVVAGDFDPATNALLDSLGVRTRVDGAPVRDDRNYWKGPALPVATNVSADAPGSPERLTLNHGSVLRNASDATVWVRTSEFAYVDENRNGSLDAAESLGRRPVVAVERVGRGRVVVVSDPSVFINSMLAREGNRAFARGLFAGEATVLFDYSHAGGVPPLAGAVLALRGSAALQVAVFGGLLALLGLWARGRVPDPRSLVGGGADPEPPTLSREEIAALVERDHPDWDADRIRRVVDAVLEE